MSRSDALSWERREIDENQSLWASYTPDYVANPPQSVNLQGVYGAQLIRTLAEAEAKAAAIFPLHSHVFATMPEWTGTLAISLHRNCSIGVRGDHRNVYYGLGYSGRGVTLANLAGKIITDIYSGDDGEWRDLPFINAGLAIRL